LKDQDLKRPETLTGFDWLPIVRYAQLVSGVAPECIAVVALEDTLSDWPSPWLTQHLQFPCKRWKEQILKLLQCPDASCLADLFASEKVNLLLQEHLPCPDIELQFLMP
jgi:hypothetical protein